MENPNLPTLDDLVNQYADRIYRSAYLYSGNEADARDLTQDTFVTAARQLKGFRGDSAVYTWLHGILHNLARSAARKQNRQIVTDSPPELTAEPATVLPADRQAAADRLRAALDQLSERHREVILLRFYENRQIAEIATLLTVSPGTVKSRLHYALLALRQILPEEMNLFQN